MGWEGWEAIFNANFQGGEPQRRDDTGGRYLPSLNGTANRRSRVAAMQECTFQSL
jgi:hypothetical protein